MDSLWIFNHDTAVNTSAATTIFGLSTLPISASPNPFKTWINLTVNPPDGPVNSLLVYNSAGKIIADLSSRYSRGSLQYFWGAGHLPAGLYFVRMKTATNIYTKKIFLVR